MFLSVAPLSFISCPSASNSQFIGYVFFLLLVLNFNIHHEVEIKLIVFYSNTWTLISHLGLSCSPGTSSMCLVSRFAVFPSCFITSLADGCHGCMPSPALSPFLLPSTSSFEVRVSWIHCFFFRMISLSIWIIDSAFVWKYFYVSIILKWYFG